MTKEEKAINAEYAKKLKEFRDEIKEEMKYIKMAEENIRIGRIEIMKTILGANNKNEYLPDEDIINEHGRGMWIDAEEIIKRVDGIKERFSSYLFDLNSIFLSHQPKN